MTHQSVPTPLAASADWYPKKSVGDLPQDAARRFGDRTALLFEGRSYSFTEYAEQVDRAARALLALGVRPGDHVAVWLNNSPDWLFIQYAIARVGAVLVPINTRFRTDDTAYLLRQSDSAFLICHDTAGPVDFLGMVRRIVSLPQGEEEIDDPNYPRLRRVVTLSETRAPGTLNWADLLAAGDAIAPADLERRAASVDPDAVFVILYTSGSTGYPKGVMHAHILLRSIEQRGYKSNISPTDTILNYLPLFHAFGLSEGSLMSLATGARQILTVFFDPDEALDIAEREKVTILHGFDIHINMLMDAQEARPRDLSALRFGWLPAGPSNVVSVAERALRVLAPWRCFSGFGMTETWTGACVGSIDDSDEQICAGSGRPSLGFEVRIADPETDQPLPEGQQGEIQLTGFTVMKGYYNKPDETRATFSADGWLKSGDVGYWRPDGHLRFCGRIKDMLKVGGENVDTLEIESYLLGHPDIKQAFVTGIESRRLSEVPIAFVELRPGAEATEQALIDFCRNHMASFKVPRRVTFVTEFPMTGSGKIRKVDLRADARERFGVLE